MVSARTVEFQRIHRVGKRGEKKSTSRAFIARFLLPISTSDREAVLRRASLDEESRTRPDLPKEVVEYAQESYP